MNINVTRAVVVDLWSLYVSGDASDETRALVESFLKADPELERLLRRDPLAGVTPPVVAPDVEMQAFAKARRRLWGFKPLLFLALYFSATAFGRIVSDTSFDVSPRAFIATASVAAVFWIAFFVTLWRMRARVLVVPERRVSSDIP